MTGCCMSLLTTILTILARHFTYHTQSVLKESAISKISQFDVKQQTAAAAVDVIADGWKAQYGGNMETFYTVKLLIK